MAKKTPSTRIMLNLKKPLVKYDKVIDLTEGKYTAVSLVTYFHAKGIIMRYAENPILLGYCVENPLEVLKSSFPKYHVTRFNGYELFSSEDFESTTPMLGLSIRGVEPVFGIEGRIKKLLELDEVLKVKRDKPVSKEDVQRILARLKQRGEGDFLSPRYKQVKHDKEQIIAIVRQYGKQAR